MKSVEGNEVCMNNRSIFGIIQTVQKNIQRRNWHFVGLLEAEQTWRRSQLLTAMSENVLRVCVGIIILIRFVIASPRAFEWLATAFVPLIYRHINSYIWVPIVHMRVVGCSLSSLMFTANSLRNCETCFSSHISLLNVVERRIQHFLPQHKPSRT